MFTRPEAIENYFVIINYAKKGISFCLWQCMLRAPLGFDAINKILCVIIFCYLEVHLL